MEQEPGKLRNRIEACPIDDGSASPFGFDQARAGENGQMRGHGIVGNVDSPGDLSGGKAVRLVSDEQAEYIEPRRLGQSGECAESVIYVHMSRIIDI
jgi:hypothetical protein